TPPVPLSTLSCHLFFSHSSRHPRALHSFPTRRSSDLVLYWPITAGQQPPSAAASEKLNRYMRTGGVLLFDIRDRQDIGGAGVLRSEEHTSELQSRENLVCRLLLEKKKKKSKLQHTRSH